MCLRMWLRVEGLIFSKNNVVMIFGFTNPPFYMCTWPKVVFSSFHVTAGTMKHFLLCQRNPFVSKRS